MRDEERAESFQNAASLPVSSSPLPPFSPFRLGFLAALGAAALILLLIAGWYLLRGAFSILTPFVVSIAVALLLDPVVDRVQLRVARGRRLPAVLIVYLIFLLAFALLLGFVVPNLVGQARGLTERFPGYISTAEAEINLWLRSHRQIGGIALPENLDALVSQYSAQAATALRASVGHIAGVILGSVSRLLSVVLIPIITFYLLNDFDRLRARLFFLLPERYRRATRRTAVDIGEVFGNYVRGLLIVCFAYAVTAVLFLLALSFWFPGLRSYALLLGVAAGLLYAVPYVGALVSVLLSTVVVLATGGGSGGVAVVLLTMLVLNQVFDNLVTPRVVGGGVGLHPVISIFALLLGGELFGLWGMLLSVPIAASIQVVLYGLFPRLAAPTPLAFLGKQERTLRRATHDAAPPATPFVG